MFLTRLYASRKQKQNKKNKKRVTHLSLLKLNRANTLSVHINQFNASWYMTNYHLN